MGKSDLALPLTELEDYGRRLRSLGRRGAAVRGLLLVDRVSGRGPLGHDVGFPFRTAVMSAPDPAGQRYRPVPCSVRSEATACRSRSRITR